MNPGLWLPRNQYDSTLARKKQGSTKWHGVKTEVSKILLQLSCQAKPSSPWGYSCPWIFNVQCAACPMNEKGTAIRKGQLLPVHTDTSSTSLAGATVSLFVDLEKTLIWTTEAACLAECLLFICCYFQLLKWLFRWFDLCHQLSQLYGLAFCSLTFTVVHQQELSFNIKHVKAEAIFCDEDAPKQPLRDWP